MELSALTRSELIFIDPPHTSPDAVIRHMSSALFECGLITNNEDFIDSVLRREKEGPTALGEELAVPHGKCDSVVKASFCVALFPEPILWPGLEGPEPVRLVFLLAIPPNEAGTTHMQLLTQLTSSLVEDEMRNAILNATSVEQVLTLLSPSTAPAQEAPERRVKAQRLVPLILGLVALAAFINAGIHWMQSLSS
ncbi:fructose PTS transporter subunit IIA [Citrobacter werkmanii]|uniref:fructose PTS transporter subunit IIA n=1 Tax=Citrobacter werkmanii TaxID=67827 RepID=UPI00388E909E